MRKTFVDTIAQMAIGILLLAAIGMAFHVEPAWPAEYGIASYYGPGFHGRRTASGEIFNKHAHTCASPSFRPGHKPYWIRVTVLKTGKSGMCRVTDRGPVKRLGRILDASEGFAIALGFKKAGVARVKVERIR